MFCCFHPWRSGGSRKRQALLEQPQNGGKQLKRSGLSWRRRRWPRCLFLPMLALEKNCVAEHRWGERYRGKDPICRCIVALNLLTPSCSVAPGPLMRSEASLRWTQKRYWLWQGRDELSVSLWTVAWCSALNMDAFTMHWKVSVANPDSRLQAGNTWRTLLKKWGRCCFETPTEQHLE